MGGVLNLAEQTFRAGREYELVVFDRLSPREQLLLSELRADAAFYGILRPHEGSGRTIRSVDRDTALLWLGAQSPGRLPFFVWEQLDATAASRRVTQLVLDGVLEVEVEGGFVSGARALHLLTLRDPEGPPGRLNDLTKQALTYAEHLVLEEADELAARIYSFGAVPLSPAWTRRLRGTDDVLAFLGATPGSALHRDLARFTRGQWPDGASWLSWSKPSHRPPAPTSTVYKLYVSPLPDELPDAFGNLVGAFLDLDLLQFKIGANALGLLRPDKVVAYFENQETLQRAADVLAARLEAVAPHGVPFTAEIAGDGLLSWGMDPPRTARLLSWQVEDSWRLWVARRLASAIVSAQHSGANDGSASRFAVERLRLEGVDVERWIPSNAMWWLS